MVAMKRRTLLAGLVALPIDGAPRFMAIKISDNEWRYIPVWS